MSTNGNGFAERFGKRLRKLRLEQGLSQKGLATKLGHDGQGSYISRYESGAVMPNAANLRALCKALTVSADHLLFLS